MTFVQNEHVVLIFMLNDAVIVLLFLSFLRGSRNTTLLTFGNINLLKPGITPTIGLTISNDQPYNYRCAPRPSNQNYIGIMIVRGFPVALLAVIRTT